MMTWLAKDHKATKEFWSHLREKVDRLNVSKYLKDSEQDGQQKQEEQNVDDLQALILELQSMLEAQYNVTTPGEMPFTMAKKTEYNFMHQRSEVFLSDLGRSLRQS